MSCNWLNEDYFSELMCGDKRSHAALEMLVDDLHSDKERTITQFLCHSGSEDFLWGLIKLLGSDIPRMAGNAAYIIGTVAESDLGCFRILALARGQKQGSHRILEDLTRMLKFDDSESVMNAAGTMGTLAESNEGREWILSEGCLGKTLDHVTALLHADNMWTASNAALVLARLCISEDGCNKVLDHANSTYILSKLVQALGSDEAGRGMNAAFAIGRLCDMDIGRKRLLSVPESERMISSLAKMLSCDDTGASKNSCFALSCLATNKDGHTRLLNNIYADDVLKRLAELLSAEDSETGWFAAMTLRTLASQPKGCLKLREHHHIYFALKAVDMKSDVNSDLKDEVIVTLDILKRLEKPSPPNVEVIGAYSVKATWDQVTTKSGFEVKYQFFEGVRLVYTGKECCCQVDDLHPFTQYSFKMRVFTDGDESPCSDCVQVTTEEAEPCAPTNLRILGSTITQLKIGWEPPEQTNGVLKGYYVFYGRNIVEHTTDTSSIITGLTANTQYEIQVCAATSKGKGDRASVFGATAELGAHAPSRPQVTVMGRNEIHITWGPPEVPLGRITRYDVIMNGKIIYSGTDLNFTTRRLTPDTDYTFIVVALTSEGKFESRSTKRRTSRDEYDSSRPPLYQPPSVRKESLTEEVPQKQTQPKKKKSETKLSRTPSAKAGQKTTGHETSGRPSSAESALTSAHVSTDAASSTKDPQKWHPSSSLPNGIQKSKTSLTKHSVQSDIKKDSINSISKPSKDSTHTSSSGTSREKMVVRTEKVISASKNVFPVAVSYVSIHGGDDMPGDGEAGKTNFELKKSLGKTASLYDSGIASSSLKLERSKTLFIGVKHSGKNKLNQVDGENDHICETTSGGYNSRTESPDKLASVSPPLPKPTIPSQHYLDGGGHSNDVKQVSLSRSLPSPQTAQDFVNYLDVDFFDLDSPHRSKNLYKQFPIVPSLKKSIERMPTKMIFAGSSGQNTMVPEIPENQSAKTHNKFIPMQLRTQPGNLTGHLQRVNTSLLEPRGFPSRRLESLSRSHTQVVMDARHQPPQSSKRLRQHSLGNADLDLIGVATTNQHLLGKEKLVRARGSPHHRRLNHSAHLREPDSALLGQSWAS